MSGALLALALLATACGGGDAGNKNGEEGKGPITVGVSGAFAENQIVAEMYAQVLEKAGYEVKRQLDLDNREISQPAMEKGEIDVKPEYLGSLLSFLDKNAKVSSDPDENERQLKTLLDAKGLVLLDRMEANDTNALVVTKQTAEKSNLAKVSDLAPVASELSLGGPAECPERPFCIPGFKQTYGITFKGFKPLDAGGPLTVAALKQGSPNGIDVAVLFSTSSVISKEKLVALEDDKALQPAENLAPVVRKEALNPQVRKLLNSVKVNTKQITDLNAKVEIDKEDPSDVAKDFLEEQGLL